MKFITKILLLLSCIVVLNGCTEADIERLIMHYMETQFPLSQPVHVQQVFQRCVTQSTGFGQVVTRCY